MSEKEWNEDHPCWWENHDWEFDGDYNNWLWDGDKELWTFTATCTRCGLTVTTKPTSVEVTA